MPFDQPPMPSSFNVGNPAAGHMHFDASGTVWFGPDGVTEQLRFDTATGTLFFGGLIAFPTHTAWETQAAEIQAVPNNITHENTMVVQSPSVDVADDVSALLLHSGISGTKAPWLEFLAGSSTSMVWNGAQLGVNGYLSSTSGFKSGPAGGPGNDPIPGVIAGVVAHLDAPVFRLQGHSGGQASDILQVLSDASVKVLSIDNVGAITTTGNIVAGGLAITATGLSGITPAAPARWWRINVDGTVYKIALSPDNG